MTIDTILDAAMELPLEQREALLAELVERLAARAPQAVTEAWNREILSRAQDIAEGRSKLIPWDHARRKLLEER